MTAQASDSMSWNYSAYVGIMRGGDPLVHPQSSYSSERLLALDGSGHPVLNIDAT